MNILHIFSTHAYQLNRRIRFKKRGLVKDTECISFGIATCIAFRTVESILVSYK